MRINNYLLCTILYIYRIICAEAEPYFASYTLLKFGEISIQGHVFSGSVALLSSKHVLYLFSIPSVGPILKGLSQVCISWIFFSLGSNLVVLVNLKDGCNKLIMNIKLIS